MLHDVARRNTNSDSSAFQRAQATDPLLSPEPADAKQRGQRFVGLGLVVCVVTQRVAIATIPASATTTTTSS